MQSPEVAKDEERSLFRKWSSWSSGDSCSGNGQELEFDGQNSHSEKKKMSGMGAHLQYQDWGNKGKQIPGARWPQASLSRGTKSLTSKRLFSKMVQGKALTEFDS